jgi:hypothetical protein
MAKRPRASSFDFLRCMCRDDEQSDNDYSGDDESDGDESDISAYSKPAGLFSNWIPLVGRGCSVLTRKFGCCHLLLCQSHKRKTSQ